MIRFLIITAWRNFIKHKSFSLINITGLSLGICCVTAIFMYVVDDFSFDRFHSNSNRIYRVNSTTHFNGGESRYSTTSTPLAEAIRNDVPEVEQAARLFNRQATLQVLNNDSTTLSEKKYKEDHFYFADPEVLNILTFTFLKGNAATALANPNQLIINRKIANKYFGSIDNALGKLIQLEGMIPLVITAVIEDYPAQSHVQIEIISHFENYFNVEIPEIREYLKRDWLYSPVSTYTLLRADASFADVEVKIKALNNKYADERVKESVSYELQPLLDIHLFSDFTFEDGQGRIRYVYIFSAVAVLILLIACINFINLSTVHSLKRSREIGVRKVLGAAKESLASQFLAESVFYVMIATILGLLVLYLLLPTINTVAGKQLTIFSLFTPLAAGGLFMIFIATGLLAGLYPAFYITGFNPVIALKGLKNASSNKSLLIRRVLVVTQFSTSIILIVFSIIIYQQIKFMSEKSLGFQKDFMLTLPIFSDNPNSILGGGVDGSLRGRMNGFENQLLENSSIEAVTVSSVLPGSGSVRALIKTDKIKDEDNVFLPVVAVDYDFLDTYKIELLTGRNFSRDAGTDHLQAFIANEEAIKLLGWESPEKAIGQNIEALGKKATIIGVIKNYHFEGLQQPLRPLLLEVDVGKFTTFSLRLSGNNINASIMKVKEIWDATFPERVFEYNFLDEQLKRNYETEQRFGSLISYFSWIAVLISALGIFGLAAYINHQKQKEASVRKVVGASTPQVFWALSKEFIRIVILSIAVACPIGYYISSMWLADFAYRIPVGWLPFAAAALGTGLVVFVTTFYQTLKTAFVNPVTALKEE